MSARLHVDLDALVANIAHVRATVSPAELMLVVKDDAYGHGLGPVVRAAVAAGVNWFGAFDVRTGCAVREAVDDDARIFAWIAASRGDLDAAVAARIDLGIGDADLLEELAEAARDAHASMRVHLKIDTGLHRNGVRPEQWPGFVARAAALQTEGVIEVAGVWSHIAEASDAEDDEARSVYEWALRQATAAGLRPAMRHLAASAASFARPEFRYDMVRVGAFCYGIRSAGGPSADHLGLRPIGRLDADVVEVAEEFARIGLGALDGLPSSLERRAMVGTPAGSRSLVAIGATESLVAAWPGAVVGDVVTVYGPGVAGESTATDLAEIIGTIGEEVALRVSPLVPRRYTRR
ncbi:alanine racemase [Microbacterium trichothecenolyticum]|uniref:Alanine racemase n=1 Tax=Microbacterium trichothecenolyticum TaxID=69370 RepID=A0A0M2H0J9_MICTR|nr:alanine racemase [Microbacterium trichothecenolyticum]KJL39747.1 Alanine racemase [Microbacterium trichothecenolyticum]